MKKLLFLFLIIFLFSCEKKPETYCWKCSWSDYPSIVLTKCDKTVDEIIQFERESGMSCTKY